MPKGVMWTHHIVMSAQLNSLRALYNDAEPPADIPGFINHVRTHGMHARQLPAAPMMHATGMTVAMGRWWPGLHHHAAHHHQIRRRRALARSQPQQGDIHHHRRRCVRQAAPRRA